MERLKPYIGIMNQWGTVEIPDRGVAGGTARGAVTTELVYHTPGEPIKYLAELRPRFTFEDTMTTVKQLHLNDTTDPGKRVLILAPWIARPQREELRKDNADYVDLAGNVHLKGPGFLIHVDGKPPVPRQLVRREKPFNKAGLKVVYVLLVNREAATLPYRDLSKAAGVALRTANYVVEGLRKEGFIAGMEKRRKVIRRGDLLARWTEGYRTELRPWLLRKTYRTQLEQRERLLHDLGRNFEHRHLPWAVTGGEAAYRLTHHYRGEALVVFAKKEGLDLQNDLKCIPDRNGDLQMLEYFGTEIEHRGGQDGIPLAHPLLVYAELIAEGTERARETAEILWRDFLGEVRDDV